MPISAEDRAIAKKAYGEMQARDAGRAFALIFAGLTLLQSFLCLLAFAFGRLELDQRAFHSWNDFFSAHQGLITIWVILLMNVISYRRSQVRYADNLKVVSELERKYAGELPYGLEQEIRSELGKKPLLWRLDALLSRKKVVA